ncbi:SGNH/GDSL hydrolase family protein [Pontibacter ramchanderi]|uniref:Lysophospholipase L1-like esterase n=1 Tax=Pontibacter ramchanderi TaxID=1179743 RepID=A0A2N3UA09_9BACT|nr:SGNH/GDSL hydrolase family protein [Pontibacter ramchanderi]PKV63554.1 lysophospholipase L1-like esterase [Pontibacter ramchanderi]
MLFLLSCFRKQAYTFILFLFLGFEAQAQSQPIKIMPLGNSITQGNMEFVSYRYPLWTKLIDEGLNVEFVGSHTENDGGTPVYRKYKGQSFSNRNEGHWGWTADEILNGRDGKGTIAQWAETYTPDVVLMHLGTNDMFRNQGIDETVTELKAVIAAIHEKSPGVTIFIAKLIPADGQQVGPTPAQNIQLLNQRIEELVDSQSPAGPPLILVDQNTGFNAVKDTYDGVHPNASGMEKMAQVWFEAIMNEIIVPLPVELNNFKGVATQSGVQLSWETASELDNAFFEVQRGQSATEFDSVGRVEGAGTTSLPQRYTYQDEMAAQGVHYYRLRQVDYDGTESYSAVLAVSLMQATTEEMRVFPTQTKSNHTVTVQVLALQPQEKFSISIYTLEGKLVKEFEAEADHRGNFTQLLPTADLRDGSMYMVRATLPGRAFIRHLMVGR